MTEQAIAQPEGNLVKIGFQPYDALTSSWQSALSTAMAPNSVSVGLVTPTTITELIEVIAYARQQRWALLPCGQASKLDWGGLVGEAPSPLLGVSLQRMNQLVDHAVGDLTVTIEAGMGFAALQDHLRQAGQFLPLDPAYPDRATIGGIVATADAGSLRQRYGGVRDLLLGISFVRADGQTAKAGGRVVKNVAGYDLMKLFTGSYGTLGILTQITFRVYPLPETSQTVVLTGDTTAIAQIVDAILKSTLTPTSLDLLSPGLVLNLGLGQEMGLAVRFQSVAVSVEQQCNRTLAIGQSLGAIGQCWVDQDEQDLWQRLQASVTEPPLSEDIICKIGVKPAMAVPFLRQAETLGISSWFGQIHAGVGLGRLRLPADTAIAALLALRAFTQSHGGFLSILRATPSFKQQVDVWGYSGNALPLMQKLKHQFDLDRRLSPHRFVGGL